jgi:hypothetical protein
VAAGRFSVDDPARALATAAGLLMGLGILLNAEPGRDADSTTDAVAEDVLRLFGMTAREAHRVCSRPLPEIYE